MKNALFYLLCSLFLPSISLMASDAPSSWPIGPYTTLKKQNRKPAASSNKPISATPKSTPSVGTLVMIQNSLREYNDKIARIEKKHKNGDMTIRLANGSRRLIRKQNIEYTLAVEASCLPSNGANICKGDSVYYPQAGIPLEIPEGKVEMIFENGKVLLLDGIKTFADISKLGKRVDCSPKKNLCVNDAVTVENRLRGYSFDGQIDRAYTNGIVVVKGSDLWKYPTDIKSVHKRVATTENNAPAQAITSRNFPLKKAAPEQTTTESDSTGETESSRQAQ